MKKYIPKPVKVWANNHGLLTPSLKLLSKIEERFFWKVFDARLKRTTPVLVYQMGKVASSSVHFSLKEVYPGIVLHAHSFNPDHEDWQIRKLYEQTIVEANPLNIISLTREPIRRNVSAFFQNFERDTGTKYQKHNYSIPELRELFLENSNHKTPLVWFDENIKANFDIDVYTKPFPECGIEKYAIGNKRLLVMRSEIVDKFKISAIQDFLDLQEFNFVQRNIGSQKEYAEEYRLFVDSVKLPPDYISMMVHSKYFSHFYGRNRSESVINKWRDNETLSSPLQNSDHD